MSAASCPLLPLFPQVRVSTDADLAKQIGHDRFFDLVDHDKVTFD